MVANVYKYCQECEAANPLKAIECKGCGFGFILEKEPPLATPRKTLFTQEFLNAFRNELDAIKQTPPWDRRK